MEVDQLQLKPPASVLERVEDFLRLYAPAERDTAVSLALQQGEDEQPHALFAELEAQHGVPGFFARQHLHFGSALFDPALALYDPHLVPPYPAARPLDNVFKAQCLLPQAVTAAERAAPPRQAVQLGVLHAGASSSADAAYWRGDVPGTVLDWHRDSLLSAGPLAWLVPLLKERAAVRVLTRQRVNAHNLLLCEWQGWLKGADGEGNVLLVGAERRVLGYTRGTDTDTDMDTAGGAAGGQPVAVGSKESILQALLAAHTVVSVSRWTTTYTSSGAARSTKEVDSLLRR